MHVKVQVRSVQCLVYSINFGLWKVPEIDKDDDDDDDDDDVDNDD